MFKLLISAKAKKELRQISKQYQRQAINEAFLEIKEDPLIGKPLGRELTNRYSYRVGVNRIIYVINEKDKTVAIISAGHRAIIYKPKILPKK